MCGALIETAPRFAQVFEQMYPVQARPHFGVESSWGRALSERALSSRHGVSSHTGGPREH